MVNLYDPRSKAAAHEKNIGSRGSSWPNGAPRIHGMVSDNKLTEKLLPDAKADSYRPYVDIDTDDHAPKAELLAPEHQPPFCCRPCVAAKQECASVYDYVKELNRVFGGGFILYCVSTYLCIKGAVASFIGLGQLPYYREMGLSAAQYQIYVSVSTTPWSMKALYGLLSDTISCCGYRKRGYIVFCSAIAVAVFATLAIVPFDIETAVIAAILFFFGSVDVALVDLLVQGKYAEVRRFAPLSKATTSLSLSVTHHIHIWLLQP